MYGLTVRGAQRTWAILYGSKIFENRGYMLDPGWYAVCVCVCVCVYTFMRVYVYVCMYVCMYVAQVTAYVTIMCLYLHVYACVRYALHTSSQPANRELRKRMRR